MRSFMEHAFLILASVSLVSLVSFVGVFTVSIKEKYLRKILTFLVPLAVGALLGDALLHLLPEAFEQSNNTPLTSLLIILGVLIFFVLEKYLRWHHHPSDGIVHEKENDQNVDNKHLAHLILISDGFHNFIDGIIIASSYLVGGTEVGLATTLAIILHETPQEIGDFGVLLHAGYKRGTALLYNFFSALTAIFGALLVLVFGSTFEHITLYALPFAAGIFIYIANADLVPELQKNKGAGHFLNEILGILLGILLMYLLLFLE